MNHILDDAPTKEQLIDELIILRHQNEMLTTLYEACSFLLTDFLPWCDSFNKLVQRIGQLVGTPHSFIGLMTNDTEKKEIEFKAGTGIFSKRTNEFDKLVDILLKTGNPTIISDPDIPEIAEHNRRTMQAVMVMPLTFHAQLLGLIGIAYDIESGRMFQEDEINLIEAFAGLIC